MATVEGGALVVSQHDETSAAEATRAHSPQPDVKPNPITIDSSGEFGLQASHSESAATNYTLQGTAQQSQPMPMPVPVPTPTVIASSVMSIKKEDATGPSPYGTRSRNRSGARPNYADDIDMEIDFPISKTDTDSSKHSTPPDSRPGCRTINEAEFASSQNAPKASKPGNGLQRPGSPASFDKVSPQPDSTSQPEKKKRKYERVNGAKPLPDSRNARDSIPGMSQFFAQSGAVVTPDPPPSKKRKTLDGNALNISATATSTGTATSSRKSSSSHVTKHPGRETCLVTFEKSRGMLQDGKLEADDGSVYAVNDHVYLICEPPGEPYYLCRIMEFRRANTEDPNSPVTSMLVNWFYRPKDIQKESRAVADSRYLFASMQSDESPISSLRGKCEIRHRSQIGPTARDLDQYRKRRNTFWFDKLFDRYITRQYEMVPSSMVTNVPGKVKKVLDEQWDFLVVEPARLKDMTKLPKLCKRCTEYCAFDDSVECAVCHNTYHMTCVRPALAKKPSRGFGWSCGPCSRAQEKRLEARHTALLPEPGADRDDDVIEEEDDEVGTVIVKPPADQPQVATTDDLLKTHAETDAAQSNMWLWRYLGIHCRVEDVLQYDDRAIYPRASSRLGPRHQAIVMPWYGHLVELVKPMDIKRRYIKGPGVKKDPKLSKETLAAIEADKLQRAKRPKWVQDEPPGYVARGEDYGDSDERATAQKLFIMPTVSYPELEASNERAVDEYMSQARALAKEFGLARKVYPGFRSAKHPSQSEPQEIVPTNYLDRAIQLLNDHNFNAEAALQELRITHSPKDIGDPDLTKEELKKFEDGVAKHGSDLRMVRKHLKTRPHGEIVRLYYSWKKSERGQEIWSQHGERRRSSKRAGVSWTDIADDEDDSAFDNEKSVVRKCKFQCKFCLTRSSRQWRRAPNLAPGAIVLADPKGNSKDKANQLIVALCHRCALLWRKYALRWEEPDDLAKSLTQSGGRAIKRKVDEELLREIVYANEAANVPTTALAANGALSLGVHVTLLFSPDAPKKKAKNGQDKESTPAMTDVESQAKKKEKEKVIPLPPPPPPPRAPTPPIEPQPPKWRDLPCSVCRESEIDGDKLMTCNHCKMTVHRRCYAIPAQFNLSKWLCDTCSNDKNTQCSLDYKCVLCPVTDRKPDLIEPPKVSHKKKNDRDREKERLEKILATEMASKYHKQQSEKGRPLFPREAVKKTASKNWMHMVCAIWTPEIRFGEADKMESAEGMVAAMSAPGRGDALCKLCRIVDGSCVSCHQCHVSFHVACAHEAGYLFGFDITPVKGSRKDMVQTVTLGEETGSMTAAIWCKEHTIKTIFHGIHEMVSETGLNALQTFVHTFKQADRTLTGTARKASIFSQLTKAVVPMTGPTASSRRTSIITNGVNSTKSLRASPPSTYSETINGPTLTNGLSTSHFDTRRCSTCNVDASVQWWQADSVAEGKGPPDHGRRQVNGIETIVYWQCHKCHMREKLGIQSPPQENTMEEVQLPLHQPDFFELTAPRPLPPQLLPNWPQNIANPPLPPHPAMAAIPLGGPSPPVDQWTLDLRASTVTVTNQQGRAHKMSGSIFGRIDDAPVIAWNFFTTHAQDSLGFDPSRHAVITEDGSVVSDSRSLMTALASLLRERRRESHWRIVDHMQNGAYQMQQPQQPVNPYPPPPPLHRGPAYPPMQAPGFPGPTSRSSSTSSVRPPPPLAALNLQQSMSSLPEIPAPNAPRQSPYYTRSPSSHTQVIPSAFATGSTSPANGTMHLRRSPTPREQQQTGNASGASSSPNLRNLVH